MVAYYFLETAYVNETAPVWGWTDTGYFGEYLGDNIHAKIFKKIIPSGLHTMEGRIQAVLFTRSGNTILKSNHYDLKALNLFHTNSTDSNIENL